MHQIWDWTENNERLNTFFQHPQPLSYILKLPLNKPEKPLFNYCTPASHLLAFTIETFTNQPLSAFAQVQLGDILGIDLRQWGKNPQGVAWGGTELSLTVDEMNTLGQWILGEYHKPGLLPPDWISQCWSVKTQVYDLYFESFVPHIQGYGYGWWMSRLAQQPMIAALGYGGQCILIFPESDVIISGISLMNASHPGNIIQFQKIMKLVEEILKKLSDI